jgi:hypothetical protein
MGNGSSTVRRTLQFKFTLPTADASHILSMLRAAEPFFQAWGSTRSRLSQNVDDPARFVHEIEYETLEEMELNRQRIASDPRVQTWLATWRALLQGAIEVDVYQEAG